MGRHRRGKGEGTVFQRRDGRWQAEVTLGYDDAGRQKRKTVYGKTQAEVIAKQNQIKHQLASGTFSDTKMKLKAYVEQWLKYKEDEVKPQTVEDYRYQFDKYILPKIGGITLTKLNPLHIQGMCGDLAKEVSSQRANKCRRILSGALKQAVRWELIPRNPVEATKPFRVEKKDMVLWSTEEVLRFLTCARSHSLYAAFYLAMSTGLRRGELLGLRWKDIAEQTITIKQNLIEQHGRIMISTPKTDKGNRRIAIASDVLEALDNHRKQQEAQRQLAAESWADTELVFTTAAGTAIHPRNFERTWYDLQKRAGVRRIRLHDLRHLHASLLISAGQDVQAVADRLGHTNPSFTLDTYSHQFEEQKVKSAIPLSRLLTTSKNSSQPN